MRACSLFASRLHQLESFTDLSLSVHERGVKRSVYRERGTRRKQVEPLQAFFPFCLRPLTFSAPANGNIQLVERLICTKASSISVLVSWKAGLAGRCLAGVTQTALIAVDQTISIFLRPLQEYCSPDAPRDESEIKQTLRKHRLAQLAVLGLQLKNHSMKNMLCSSCPDSALHKHSQVRVR